MRPRLALLLGAALASFAALAPANAHAYDVLAAPCASQPLTCGVGPVSFTKVDALPIQFNFDTGWVPSGSPVQVHLWADVWANTHVTLAGKLQSAWPMAMTLDAPGDHEGGQFGFHYGADFGAQGKVTISVAGQTYSWTGDIPYVPNFDFEVKADQGFDAWGWQPGVTLKSKTMPAEIASVDLSTIIGTSIPGIDGGFALDVAMEFDATYQTNRIVIDHTDGSPVSGGAILKDGDQSLATYTSGPNIELDIHPEGTVDYDGVVHLIPTFWVSLLGKKWDIPIVDIPISFPITQTDWIFDPQRVHFPLPDLALSVQEIDFGEVPVGFNKTMKYQMWNAGEALVAATMSTSDALNFPLLDDKTTVDPGTTFDASVQFIPQKGGPFVGQIVVASNDPNSPAQIIKLKGTGKAMDMPPPPPPPTMDEPQANMDSSCGCRTAGEERGAGLGVLGIAALAAIARVRRRRS
jgi:MYXO-CTERM domain-containing protein